MWIFNRISIWFGELLPEFRSWLKTLKCLFKKLKTCTFTSFEVLRVFCPFQLLLQILISFKVFCSKAALSTEHGEPFQHFQLTQFVFFSYDGGSLFIHSAESLNYSATKEHNNNNGVDVLLRSCGSRQTWKFHFDNHTRRSHNQWNSLGSWSTITW